MKREKLRKMFCTVRISAFLLPSLLSFSFHSLFRSFLPIHYRKVSRRERLRVSKEESSWVRWQSERETEGEWSIPLDSWALVVSFSLGSLSPLTGMMTTHINLLINFPKHTTHHHERIKKKKKSEKAEKKAYRLWCFLLALVGVLVSGIWQDAPYHTNHCPSLVCPESRQTHIVGHFLKAHQQSSSCNGPHQSPTSSWCRRRRNLTDWIPVKVKTFRSTMSWWALVAANGHTRSVGYCEVLQGATLARGLRISALQHSSS